MNAFPVGRAVRFGRMAVGILVLAMGPGLLSAGPGERDGGRGFGGNINRTLDFHRRQGNVPAGYTHGGRGHGGRGDRDHDRDRGGRYDRGDRGDGRHRHGDYGRHDGYRPRPPIVTFSPRYRPRPYYVPRYYDPRPSIHVGIGYGAVIRPRPVIIERPVVVEREVIVERPVVIDPAREIGAEERAARASAHVVVELEGYRYVLDDGAFFRMTENGREWVETPVGAVMDELPIGAETVWFEEDEFFEFDGAFFRRSPEGFKVVIAPWKKDGD